MYVCVCVSLGAHVVSLPVFAVAWFYWTFHITLSAVYLSFLVSSQREVHN